MFREKNIGLLTLNGRGLKYSNFLILTTESLNNKVQYAICKATALKYKTRWRYKTKRLPTDFWPTLYLYFFHIYIYLFIMDSIVDFHFSSFQV